MTEPTEPIRPNDYAGCSTRIVGEIGRTMSGVNPDQVERLIDMIESAHRVFFIGVGRVLLSIEAMAKRLNHLGIDCVMVGDITEPAITPDDLLIVGSGSGKTGVPLFIAGKAKSLGAKVAHIGNNPDSPMARIEDLFVKIPTAPKEDVSGHTSIQPMTSLFEQCLLLLGDTIALMIVDRRNLDLGTLWEYHANLE